MKQDDREQSRCCCEKPPEPDFGDFVMSCFTLGIASPEQIAEMRESDKRNDR